MLFNVSPEDAKKTSLFSGLMEQEKETLLKAGRSKRYTRGEMLFAHGDPVTHFYMIASGLVQLYRATPDGHEKTIALAQAGQTLCEDEIMDSCRGHRVNAVAVEDTNVMEFPVAWLKESAKTHPAFALNLLSLIASRAHLAELEAEHQASMSAAQLVACFLQRMCVLNDFDPGGFELPYSKTLIASRLGMELETFSRTLAKLKEHGIRVEGTRVSIHNLGKIEEYVCGACSISDDCATHNALAHKTCGN